MIRIIQELTIANEFVSLACTQALFCRTIYRLCSCMCIACGCHSFYQTCGKIILLSWSNCTNREKYIQADTSVYFQPLCVASPMCGIGCLLNVFHTAVNYTLSPEETWTTLSFLFCYCLLLFHCLLLPTTTMLLLWLYTVLSYSYLDKRADKPKVLKWWLLD